MRYLDLVRHPGTARLTAAASLGRLVYGGIPLAILVFVAQSRDSYAEAGLVLALNGVVASMLGPYRARVVERVSARRVILAMGGLYLLAIIAFVFAVNAPLPLLLGAAAAAGAFPPPVGPLTRAEWRRRLGPDQNVLRLAYSFDATTEQAIYAVAPIVSAFAVGLISPGAIVVAGGALLFISAGGLASSMSKSEAPEKHSEESVAGIVVSSRRLSPVRNASFILGLMPIVGLNLITGGVEVTVLAVALDTVNPQLAGIPIGALAVGSAAGGLLYGRRKYPGTLHQQALLFVLASAAFILLAAIVFPIFVLLVIALTLAGLWVAPAFVCSYLIAENAAPAAGAEASAWVNAAGNLSLSLSTAAAGLLVQHFSAAPALGTLVVTGAAVASLPQLSRIRTSTNPDDESADTLAG